MRLDVSLVSRDEGEGEVEGGEEEGVGGEGGGFWLEPLFTLHRHPGGNLRREIEKFHTGWNCLELSILRIVGSKALFFSFYK